MIKFKKFHIDILFDIPIYIQILPSAPIMAFIAIVFSDPGYKPGSHISFHCYTSLVSFILEQIFSYLPSFTILTFLKSTGQLCRMSLSLDLSGISS